MKQQISSDRPVSLREEDRFQRFDFSKRIAEKIINSSDKDSIVIGIFGAWGEGKTSVINFIESELKNTDSIIPVRFNPWRFTDEATLLVSFFNTLAIEVKKSIPSDNDIESIDKKTNWFKDTWNKKKEPLKTNKETIGDVLEKYGKIVSIFGAGEAAESIGKALSNVDVETLKTRFEKLLVESNKKLVIFIDDIDRLDKQEIHAIFRLVKLTADFSNTFYILSFDQEMVASAIGERFGEGDKKAGLNFLEKIIQVPLNIPLAQPDALKQYCFELIDKAINDSGVTLSKEDVQRFVSEFVENILTRLKTPRLAVRYGNTLSFAFPLLKGEVNLVDLMLIEAVKVFYPKHYEFIKENPHYFLNSYSSNSRYSNNDSEVRKKEITDHFELLGSDLTRKEKNAIKSLLSELFPRLDEAFRNTFYQGNDWFKKKRIVSPDYFQRYFSYTVLKGELSDVSFDEFSSQLEVLDVEQIKDKIKQLIDTSSTDNFLHKLRSLEEDFNWVVSKKLAIAIALSGSIFPDKNTFFGFGVDTPKGQAAIFIYQLINKHGVSNENFELAAELFNKSQPFEFSFEIFRWLIKNKSNEEELFEPEQILELKSIILKRALNEANGQPLFKAFPKNVYYLFNFWKDINKQEMDDNTSFYLSTEPECVVDLLRAFLPEIMSSNYPEPYKSDLSKDQYEYFVSLFDKELIYKTIQDKFSDVISEKEVEFSDRDNSQTDINMLRQFVHWYENEKNGL